MSNNLIEYAKSLWKDNDGDSAMQMLIDYLRTKDMVEVVRCKECIHLQESGHCDKTCLWIGNKEDGGCDDFFCAWGERKTE